MEGFLLGSEEKLIKDHDFLIIALDQTGYISQIKVLGLGFGNSIFKIDNMN